MSVGEEDSRRLVVYLKQYNNTSKNNTMLKQTNDGSAQDGSSDEISCKTKTKKPKRPDILLYKPPKRKSPSGTDAPDNKECLNKCEDGHGEPKSVTDNASPASASSDFTWDSLYDDNGEVIDSQVVDGLNDELGVKLVTEQLAASKLDYCKYFNDDVEPSERQHENGNILEIYDFSSDLKTRDLMSSLSFKYVAA